MSLQELEDQVDQEVQDDHEADHFRREDIQDHQRDLTLEVDLALGLRFLWHDIKIETSRYLDRFQELLCDGKILIPNVWPFCHTVMQQILFSTSHRWLGQCTFRRLDLDFFVKV